MLVGGLTKFIGVVVGVAAIAIAAFATLVVHDAWQTLAAPVAVSADRAGQFDVQFSDQSGKSDRQITIEALDVAEKAPEQPVALDGRALLNDAQITALKARLQLTPVQQQYWPAVEAALRQFSYRFLQPKKSRHARTVIDINAPEVQRLIEAATPLLNELRQD